jgi:hypothetical protein
MAESKYTVNPVRTITVVCRRCEYVEHVTVGGQPLTGAICEALDYARYNGCDCKKKVAAVLDAND